MSRSDASAYSALGITQTVTDPGEVRLAASRFMVIEPSAHATLRTRSVVPGLPRRARDRASSAKMTAPVSSPSASRIDGTWARLAWSTNAYWARKLTYPCAAASSRSRHDAAASRPAPLPRVSHVVDLDWPGVG